MKNPKKILIIIQRSNGDVFLSLSLINALYDYYHFPLIDLLVNDDTLRVAKLLPHINFIHTFSYQKKRDKRWNQEKEIITNIYKKYDLSINLTASDRSVIYALLAGKKSISAIEKENRKSWWKKSLLTYYYFFDVAQHILCNNLEPLNLLKINHKSIQDSPDISVEVTDRVNKKLTQMGITDFMIFHPSAQYDYKIYPEHLRNELLFLLNELKIPIIVTGGNSEIDLLIKKTIPPFENIFNWIGETSIEEYIALSEFSQGYIGMDTLNTHIAATQNKRIFAIFGPTSLKMWSPWSNNLKTAAKVDKPIQTYGNITIFQADLPCVACGMAGCSETPGRSECLYRISPERIFHEIKDWYQNAKFL